MSLITGSAENGYTQHKATKKDVPISSREKEGDYKACFERRI